jgi:hypothetical protein
MKTGQVVRYVGTLPSLNGKIGRVICKACDAQGGTTWAVSWSANAVVCTVCDAEIALLSQGRRVS